MCTGHLNHVQADKLAGTVYNADPGRRTLGCSQTRGGIVMQPSLRYWRPDSLELRGL
jgi:hypothetical protein